MTSIVTKISELRVADPSLTIEAATNIVRAEMGMQAIPEITPATPEQKERSERRKNRVFEIRNELGCSLTVAFGIMRAEEEADAPRVRRVPRDRAGSPTVRRFDTATVDLAIAAINVADAYVIHAAHSPMGVPDATEWLRTRKLLTEAATRYRELKAQYNKT